MYYLSYCIKRKAIKYAWERERSFIVVEEPLAQCSVGERVLAILFKRGIDTLGALRAVARLLHLPVSSIGVAGLKDANASTIQYVSLPLTPLIEKALQERKVFTMANGRVILRLLCRTRIRISPGKLKGNRFTIVLRVNSDVVKELIKATARQPLLNYYGYQRFGTNRPNTHVVGLLLALSDPILVNEVIGSPYPDESEEALHCRLSYWRGDCRLTKRKWYEHELVGEYSMANLWTKIRKVIGRLALSGLQAYIFNLYLSERVKQGYDHTVILTGERRGVNGYPLAPIPGRGVKLEGEARRVLREALEAHGLSLSLVERIHARGYWRPLYVKPRDLESIVANDLVVLRFSLEKGAYATTLLREIAKNPLDVA